MADVPTPAQYEFLWNKYMDLVEKQKELETLLIERDEVLARTRRNLNERDEVLARTRRNLNAAELKVKHLEFKIDPNLFMS